MNRETIIEEAVQEHMSGTEIKVDVIENNKEEYNSDDRSVFMNFHFNQMMMKINENLIHTVNMTSTEKRIKKTYSDTDLLIDTGLTCSVFKNPRMLTDVKRSKTIMRTVSNG